MKGENTEKSEEVTNTQQVKCLKHMVFASLQDLINQYAGEVYEMIAGLRAGETKAGESWVDLLMEQGREWKCL